MLVHASSSLILDLKLKLVIFIVSLSNNRTFWIALCVLTHKFNIFINNNIINMCLIPQNKINKLNSMLFAENHHWSTFRFSFMACSILLQLSYT